MKQISTQHLLVKKVYGETSSWENEMLASKIAEDWTLKEELETMSEVAQALDSTIFAPSNTSIKIILEHSRKTAPVLIS